MQLPLKNLNPPIVLDSIVDKWDKSFKNYKFLTKDQQDLFYWTNYSRANPKRFWDSVINPALKIFPELKSSYSVSLYKDLFLSPELSLLKLNSPLLEMAESHALEIGKSSLRISHNSPDGSTFADRFHKYGIQNCGAENISLSDDILLGLVLLYIDYNLPELGHRKNLLSPDFSEIGIGVCKYGSTDNLFFVQDFSCPQ